MSSQVAGHESPLLLETQRDFKLPLGKEKEAQCFQLKLTLFCVLRFPYKAGEGDLFSFPSNL